MNKEGKRKGVSLLYEDLHLQSLLGNNGEGTIRLVCTSWRPTTQLEHGTTDSYTQRVKETKTLFFWVERDEDFLIKKKKDCLFFGSSRKKKKKTNPVCNSINSGILTRWCIIVRDGCWRVLTRSIILTKGWIGRWFSFSFFRMFSTISSMNSDSGLQLEV